MKLSTRQQKLIHLIANKELITAKELSEKLTLSSRTIRDEVKNINQISNIPLIIPLKGQGYQLNLAHPDLSLYLSASETSNEYTNIRNTQILKAILANDTTDYYEIAETFFISESTIDKIIRDFNQIIQTRFPSLTIKRKNNKIIIPNDEQSKRQIFAAFLTHEMHDFNFDISNYNTFFSTCDLQKLSQVIIEFNREYNLQMRDFELLSFILHIAIIIERSRNNAPAPENYENYVNAESNKLAMIFSRFLREREGIKLPAAEIPALSLLFAGKITDFSLDDVNKLKQFIDDLILDINRIYSFDLSQNFKFKDNLLIHLLGLEKRIKNNTYILNPLIKDIKVHFPILYDISVYIAVNIQKKYKCLLIEDEIGYITLHLMNTIENFQQKETKKIIIISSLGKIEAEYTKNQISNAITAFNIEIVRSLSFLNAYECKELMVDLIISTQPLAFIPKSPLYVCSNMLLSEDILKIQNILFNAKNLTSSINTYFDERLFFYDKEFANSQEIIHFLCNHLKQLGYCDQYFEQKVIEREQVAPTTYGNLFAIPHPIEKCAFKNVIAVCILKDPILWQGQKTKLILLFALSPKQEKGFDKIFEKLVTLLNDVTNVKELCKQTSLPAFLDIFAN